MLTVRPKVDSSNREGQVAEEIKVENHVKRAGCNLNPVEEVEDKDDASVIEEDVEEGAPAKSIRSPSAPSHQEMLEHSTTHSPFRSRCVHCLRGKCKSSKHASTGGAEDSAVPLSRI